MIDILCYGDSNTYGVDPHGGRHPWPIRWPGRLQILLGPDYHIIEEGMCGRTTVYDDPLEPDRNGARALPLALSCHSPLDIVIIALGANDCKTHFHATPVVIARGIERLCKIVKTHMGPGQEQPPKMIIISPAHVLEGVENGPYCTLGPDSVTLSRQLAPYYEKVAKEQGAVFFDAQTAAHASPLDCLHMDREAHLALADALVRVIKELDV